MIGSQRATIVLSIAGGFLGAMLANLWLPNGTIFAQQVGPEHPKVLEAKEFRLVDKDGAIRVGSSRMSKYGIGPPSPDGCSSQSTAALSCTAAGTEVPLRFGWMSTPPV